MDEERKDIEDDLEINEEDLEYMKKLSSDEVFEKFTSKEVNFSVGGIEK